MKKLSFLVLLWFNSTCFSQVVINQERSTLIDREEAYSMYLDNSLKRVETYWAIKALYKEHQQEKLDEIARKRQFYLSKHALLPLEEKDYNSSSGTINWPKQFKQAVYQEYTETYDRLMKKSAYEGLDIYEYGELKDTSKKLRLLIAEHSKYYPESIMSEMIRFVIRLDKEVAKI